MFQTKLKRHQPREISCFVFGSEEYELMQVKVKNSRELKRHVSQNISSNSWSSVLRSSELKSVKKINETSLTLLKLLW